MGDTVDAGVHPTVAKMRLAQKGSKEGQNIVVEGMDLLATPWLKKAQDLAPGYTFAKRNGAASATPETHPHAQLDRLVGAGVNPQDFFMNSKQTGINIVSDVLRGKDGPDLPGKEKKKKKSKSKKDKKEKKGKKSKDKKNKKKTKDKKK